MGSMLLERREFTSHRDSGVVAVETAIISMFLVTMLFGIVDSSFFFKDYITVSAAARAGARMGASQPRMPNFASDSAAQVTNAIAGLNPANLTKVWVYQTTGATGSPPGSCTDATNCVPFSWDVPTQKLTTTASGNWLNTDQNACAGDVNRDSLGVYVAYKHTSPTGLFFNNQIIGENTVMWIEPWNADVHCKPGA